MSNEPSCESSKQSFEVDDILKKNEIMMNDNELGNKKCGANNIANIDKSTKNIEMEGNAQNMALAVIQKDENMNTESIHKEQSDNSGRRRSSRHRSTKSTVDGEVGKESNTPKKPMTRQSVSGRKRRTIDSNTLLKVVEQGNNEPPVAAKTRLRLSQPDDGKSNENTPALETETSESLKFVSNSGCTTTRIENETGNEEENQEDSFVQFASQNADSNVNAEGQAIKLLGSAPIKLPFEKSSPFWENIESSKIFLNMPQQPHFNPLKKYVESCREGMAIGLMVSFSNIVNKLSKFCLTNPDGSIEEMVDSLVDLEMHGFNLYNLSIMLENLRNLKADHKRVMGELHTMNDLKSDIQIKGGLLDEEIEGIRKSIRELELKEKLLCDDKSSMLEQSEGYEHEISRLQNGKEEIEKSFQTTKRYLDRVQGGVE